MGRLYFWSLLLVLSAVPMFSLSGKTTLENGGNRERSAGSRATLIDDFEAPASATQWVFSNGPEFPGATGDLTFGGGYQGNGAHLAFDFTGGGNYVSADLELRTPVRGDAISFWIRAPEGNRVSLRVRDGTGQVLQYDRPRPLEATDPDAWYQQLFELDTPSVHWGGANDGVLHGEIGWVGILANNLPQDPGLTGAIDFDEVVLFDIQHNFDPFSVTLLPSGCSGGELMANVGVNIHFPVYPRYDVDLRALDMARDAGFQWVRMDLFWGYVERTPGLYSFAGYDELISELDRRGMRAVFILDYSNPLYSDCVDAGAPCLASVPQSPATIRSFGDYAEAAARHFAGHGVRYEVWNEPNIGHFWARGPNAYQYAALANEAVARVHQGDAAALVTTGGLSGFDFAFLRALIAGGGVEGADAIGVHPYTIGNPEAAADGLTHMRSILSHAGIARAIWDTEWGYSSSWYSVTPPSSPGGDGTTPAARRRQSVMALREMFSTQAMGFPLAIYYDIQDDGTNPYDAEHNFGLLTNDYVAKPAMIAFRTLKSLSTGRVFAGFLATKRAGLHALRLDGPSDMVVILWSDQRGKQIAVSLPATATAIDMFGAPISLSASNGGLILTLAEASGPLYVTLPPASKTATPDLSSPGSGGRNFDPGSATIPAKSVSNPVDSGSAPCGTAAFRPIEKGVVTKPLRAGIDARLSDYRIAQERLKSNGSEPLLVRCPRSIQPISGWHCFDLRQHPSFSPDTPHR